MGFKPFLKHTKIEDIATWFFSRIVDRMSQRECDEVAQLFGAKLGPHRKDDKPISQKDLPQFGEGTKPPSSETYPYR